MITPRLFTHSAEQDKRLKHLRDFCISSQHTYGISSLIRFLRSSTSNKAHFYVSHNMKLVYCSVPKVASTNWKRLLLMFEQATNSSSVASIEKNNVHALPQVRLFNIISKEGIKQTLFHYYKFLFVRHPFERLVSAYRNKFEENNKYFHKTYGSQILRLYRANLTEKQYRRGNGVKFEEFILWILQKRVFDGHWSPIDSICHPCVLPYDFIGKMESLVADSEQILKDLGSQEHFPAHLTDKHKTSLTSKQLIQTHFSKLSKETIRQLYQRYKVDFEAFDYKLPNITCKNG